ncbi:hypothetical protein [Alicyclobacillus shizuokensis]|uniref:hypothetical protein n=1 Tax=Alicyclobacillus shizuokensis TaxID=392014 RepID=UPI0008343BD9|nr:hypothetical protein [Alicyclobacillus shizuokensis]MCL6626906.1 toxin-antitoxin system HicB family antitoxin [Alicyclobacillus shizuokensis]
MSKKKQFLLRLDPDLYDIIARWAEDELRSVNAHMEFLLRDAARSHGRLPQGQRKSAPGKDVDVDKES